MHFYEYITKMTSLYTLHFVWLYWFLYDFSARSSIIILLCYHHGKIWRSNDVGTKNRWRVVYTCIIWLIWEALCRTNGRRSVAAATAVALVLAVTSRGHLIRCDASHSNAKTNGAAIVKYGLMVAQFWIARSSIGGEAVSKNSICIPNLKLF